VTGSLVSLQKNDARYNHLLIATTLHPTPSLHAYAQDTWLIHAILHAVILIELLRMLLVQFVPIRPHTGLFLKDDSGI